MVLQPGARGTIAERDLQQVGAGFRRHRPPHRYRPHRHPPQGQRRGRYPARPAGIARRRSIAARPPRRRSSRCWTPARSPTRSASRRRCCTLVACPDLCSRRWIWDQYDSMVGGQTVQAPRRRRCRGGASWRADQRALAHDHRLHPALLLRRPRGRRPQAVAEAWRNLTAVGALPLAITDNMNFGNPEKPEIMGQFAAAIRGMAGGLHRARLPGRVRQRLLYNETEGKGDPADPGDRRRRRAGGRGPGGRASRCRRALDLVLIGETRGWLGQSLWLREIAGREEGAPPPVDLAAERRNGDFVRGADPRRHGRRLPRLSPMAGCWWRWPRWRWPAASAPPCWPARRRRPAMPTGSARTRRATFWRCRCGRAAGRRPRPPGAGDPRSAAAGGRGLGSAGGRSISVADAAAGA